MASKKTQKKRVNGPQTAFHVDSPPPDSKTWRNPLVLFGISALGAALIIGIVIWQSPRDETENTEHGFSGPRIASDSTEKTSEEKRKLEEEKRTWWQPPGKPIEANLDQLKDEMLAEAKRLEEDYPKNPMALDLCASVYYDLNRLDEADRFWKACLQLKPDKADFYLNYAEFLTGTDKPELAIKILEEAHSRKLETAGTYHELAKAYEGSGDSEKSLELSQEVTNRFPDFAASWYLQGKIQNQLGKYPEAETSLRKALELQFSQVEVLTILVAVLARQGKRDEATEMRKNLQKLEGPKNTDSSQELQPFQVKFESSLRTRASRLFLRSALIERENWNHTDSLKMAQKSLDLNPENTAALLFVADHFVQKNRLGEALRAYQRLVDLQPENVIHFTNAASIAFRVNELEIAADLLRKGMIAHPTVDVLPITLGKIYMSQNKPREAREVVSKIIETSQNPEAFMVLGATYQATGEMQQANEFFEKAKRLVPSGRPPQIPNR